MKSIKIVDHIYILNVQSYSSQDGRFKFHFKSAIPLMLWLEQIHFSRFTPREVSEVLELLVDLVLTTTLQIQMALPIVVGTIFMIQRYPLVI